MVGWVGGGCPLSLTLDSCVPARINGRVTHAALATEVRTDEHTFSVALVQLVNPRSYFEVQLTRAFKASGDTYERQSMCPTSHTYARSFCILSPTPSTSSMLFATSSLGSPSCCVLLLVLLFEIVSVHLKRISCCY